MKDLFGKTKGSTYLISGSPHCVYYTLESDPFERRVRARKNNGGYECKNDSYFEVNEKKSEKLFEILSELVTDTKYIR